MADNLSWAERTAKSIQTVAKEAADNGYTPNIYDMVLAALEASGELKTVKLKIAIARCWECFKQQQKEDADEIDITLPSDQLVNELWDLFQ